MREVGLDDLPHQQYTKLLRLSDKESVIVSPVIPFHTLRKMQEIKTVSDLTSLTSSLVLWRRINW